MLIKYLLLAISLQTIALSKKVRYYDLDFAEQYFQEFIENFERTYESKEEYHRRLNIFIENLKFINAKNEQSDSVTFGVTQFSDMTEEEMAAMLPGLMIDVDSIETEDEIEDLDDSPSSWDWREHGAVGPIKNQGGCGSCWIFSATALVEGQYGKQHGKVEPLSEQEVMDCGMWRYPGPCRGGQPSWAIDVMVNLGGWMTEQDYPYEGEWTKQCKYEKDKTVIKTSEAKVRRLKSEKSLQSLLYNTGPLSITMYVNLTQGNAWAHYTNGIATAESLTCYSNQVNNDHAINLVGYGTEDGKDYWIIKNSWGTGWGEDGYMRIERGNNACNILDYVMTTTAAAEGKPWPYIRK